MFDHAQKLTKEEILGARKTPKRIKYNPLVYPDGTKVSPDCSVIKIKNRCYILEGDKAHPVIRQSTLASGRWQYYNGTDVDKCLIQENFKDLKGVLPLTIDGISVPIFRKDYLTNYALITEDNAEVLAPHTTILFNKNNKMVVAGTERTVTTIHRKHIKRFQNQLTNNSDDCSIPHVRNMQTSSLGKRKAEASKEQHDETMAATHSTIATKTIETTKNTSTTKNTKTTKNNKSTILHSKVTQDPPPPLTTKEILKGKNKEKNQLLYPDGSPVHPESYVIKRNKRHRVVNPDGQEVPVIRMRYKKASRFVFYDGKNVQNTLEIRNPNTHKHQSSSVMMNGVCTPVFKKTALAKYILVDAETGAHILPKTPIKLIGKNTIFTQETNRPLKHLRVCKKNTIPGFKNLFLMNKPCKKTPNTSASATSSMTNPSETTSAETTSTASINCALSAASFFSQANAFSEKTFLEEALSEEMFEFDMNIGDTELVLGEQEILGEEVKSSTCASSQPTYSTPPNFFNPRASTPPIMDPKKLKVFTPGEEDKERAAEVLNGII